MVINLCLAEQDIRLLENHADPDQLASYKPADQDQHGFLSILHFNLCIKQNHLLDWFEINNFITIQFIQHSIEL